MAGVKGRSGGRNRKSVHDHVLGGSYRRDRHGPLPLPGNVASFPQQSSTPPPRDWMPTTGQRRALGRRGRGFVDSRLATYAHTPHEGDIVLRAARALDEADLWRRRSHRWKDAADAVRAGRLQLLHERAFSDALRQLQETS
jgi:hypothetical protein